MGGGLHAFSRPVGSTLRRGSSFRVGSFFPIMSSGALSLCLQLGGRQSIVFSGLPTKCGELCSVTFSLTCELCVLQGAGRRSPGNVTVVSRVSLRLRPSLRRRILTHLGGAFPDVRFVMSARSPVMLSGLGIGSAKGVVCEVRTSRSAPGTLPGLCNISCSTTICSFVKAPCTSGRIGRRVRTVLELSEENGPRLMRGEGRRLGSVISRRRCVGVVSGVGSRLTRSGCWWEVYGLSVGSGVEKGSARLSELSLGVDKAVVFGSVWVWAAAGLGRLGHLDVCYSGGGGSFIIVT